MSFPRGFYQADGGFECDVTNAAFTRGILLPTQQYDAMSIEQRLKLMELEVFPRWRLYGGPFFLKQDADQWDDFMFFWGFQHGTTWVSHGTRCIVPDYVFKWPADKSVKWEWVWETERPAAVQKIWNPNKGKYDYVWAKGGVSGVPGVSGLPPDVALPQPSQRAPSRVRWS